MFFIDNDNIHKDEHLNKSGLHLNATGNSVLASNFVGILKCFFFFFCFFVFLYIQNTNLQKLKGQYKTQYLTVEQPTGEGLHTN